MRPAGLLVQARRGVLALPASRTSAPIPAASASRSGRNVLLNMNRCIQCTRCIRFTEEISKTGELGFFERGARDRDRHLPGQAAGQPAVDLRGRHLPGRRAHLHPLPLRRARLVSRQEALDLHRLRRGLQHHHRAPPRRDQALQAALQLRGQRLLDVRLRARARSSAINSCRGSRRRVLRRGGNGRSRRLEGGARRAVTTATARRAARARWPFLGSGFLTTEEAFLLAQLADHVGTPHRSVPVDSGPRAVRSRTRRAGSPGATRRRTAAAPSSPAWCPARVASTPRLCWSGDGAESCAVLVVADSDFGRAAHDAARWSSGCARRSSWSSSAGPTRRWRRPRTWRCRSPTTREKDGTFVNVEGRVQRFDARLPAAGPGAAAGRGAAPTCWRASSRSGARPPPATVFDLLAASVPAFAGLSAGRRSRPPARRSTCAQRPPAAEPTPPGARARGRELRRSPRPRSSRSPSWLGLLINVAPIMVWVERRACALIQDRPGPNRLGPFGLFQAIADAVKFMFKEDVDADAARTSRSTCLAPVLAARARPSRPTSSSPSGPTSRWQRRTRPAGGRASADTGVLLFLALASLGVYSLVLAGYSSNNKFSLHGRDPRLGADDQLRAGADARGGRGADAGGLAAAGRRRRLPAGASGWPACRAGTSSRSPSASWSSWSPLSPRPTGCRSTCPRPSRSWSPAIHTEYGAMRFALFFMGEYIGDGGALGAGRDALPRRLEPAGGCRSVVPGSTGWLGVGSGRPRLVADLGVKIGALHVRSSSGCAGRSRASATTSSCGSAGRCCCRWQFST